MCKFENGFCVETPFCNIVFWIFSFCHFLQNFNCAKKHKDLKNKTTQRFENKKENIDNSLQKLKTKVPLRKLSEDETVEKRGQLSATGKRWSEDYARVGIGF